MVSKKMRKMKNFTTEDTEFHGVVDMKTIFPPCRTEGSHSA